jgi:hypothetical protein
MTQVGEGGRADGGCARKEGWHDANGGGFIEIIALDRAVWHDYIVSEHLLI